MAEYPDFTPVNLLTGFLGSGKTTLLKQLLREPALADTAVLINEFGEVGLDHQLVERIDESTVLLPSGCVCCTVRGELAQAMRDLHSRRERGTMPPFRRVVVESTGLADPFPTLSTLKADPVLRFHFRAGNVVTTVDAVNGMHELATYQESLRQAAVADRLVITKTDLLGAGDATELIGRLREINPDAALLTMQDGVSAADLLETGDGEISSAKGFYCEPSVAAAGSSAHGGTVVSFVVTMEGDIDWTAFGIWMTMLLNRHGERVLRIKGILNVRGEERPVAIHGVQHLVHTPVHMDAWPGADRRSRIVFIVDGLEPEVIRRSLHAFTS